MSFYRHNNTGKYFIVLESQLAGIPTEPNRGDDIVLPYIKEVSAIVGLNSEITNDAFPISTIPYQIDVGGGEVPLTTVPEFQKTLLRTINSEDARRSLETTSNSNMLGFRIKKGKLKLKPDDPEWPELLNQLSNNPVSSIVNKSVSTLISENNLYSPERPFFNPQDFNENKIVLGTIKHKNLGEHGPRKFPNVVESKKTTDQITIDQMKSVGLTMLVAASGVDPATNSNGREQQSLVDDGLKIIFGNIKPSKVLSIVNPSYRNEDNNDSVYDNSFDVQTYGSPNNPQKPFTGTQDQISSPALFGKILAIATAFKSIIDRYDLTGRNLGDHLADGSSRNRQTFLGSSTANAGAEDRALALDPFESPQIQNDFYLSVEAGFKQFFGLDDNFRLPNNTGFTVTSTSNTTNGNHAGKTSKQYGYISMFARKLNAAINEINSFTSTPQSFAFTRSRNSTPSPTLPVGEDLEKLKSNFAIKFIKILSIIGDKALTVQYMQQTVPVQGIPGYVSDIDSTPESFSPNNQNLLDPGILVVKHKLDTRNGATAYGNTTLPSMLLFPQGISDANAALVGDSNSDVNSTSVDTAIEKLNTTNLVVTNASNDRISQEDVRKMEDFLEMDYMPFYFHDLRTNEIISFHAFLESASDQLSADYNETEGYGRTGVVPIYKNTKRTISFTFKILATNKDDHEQMWYKVNRLAACLYPQYSEGRLLNYRGSKFIQPFSQVFAASPLMRIRFGDLWKTNYSKLAVARLFGLAGINDGQQATFKLARTREISRRRQTRIGQATATQTTGESSGVPQFNIPNTTRAPREGDRVEIFATAGKQRWAMLSRDNRFMGNPDEVSAAQAAGQDIGRYNILPNTFLYMPTGYVEGVVVQVHPSDRRTGNNYYVRITNARTDGSGVIVAKVIVGGNARNRNTNGAVLLNPDPTNWVVCANPGNINIILPPPEIVEEPEPEIEQLNNSIPDFFKCDGDDPNPIMKAFCSTEGRGLACVIKQMSLENLMDAPWSVERFDGRAPQLLTVNMEITPIHDINPGLDNKGFMTAPIWPTGTIVNNTMGNHYSSENGKDNFNRSRGKYLFPSMNKLGT